MLDNFKKTDKLKRKKDGTIEGITTMGDLIREEKMTAAQEEEKQKKEELWKKYGR